MSGYDARCYPKPYPGAVPDDQPITVSDRHGNSHTFTDPDPSPNLQSASLAIANCESESDALAIAKSYILALSKSLSVPLTITDTDALTDILTDRQLRPGLREYLDTERPTVPTSGDEPL